MINKLIFGGPREWKIFLVVEMEVTSAKISPLLDSSIGPALKKKKKGNYISHDATR